MDCLCVYKRRSLPSSRIRVLEMIPHLEARGVRCRAVAYPQDRAGVCGLVAEAARTDLVWLQKKLPGLPDALQWRRIRDRLVFDFDDAICFRKEPRRGSYRWPRRARRFRRITRLARGVTCGNRYLASLLPPGAPAPLLYASPVPSRVPRRDYGPRRGARVLGWIGDGGNLPSLAAIGPALARLAARHEFVLRVITDREFDWPGVQVENLPWTAEGQHAALAGLDLGLMPLAGDSPFDRGKCSFKVLQYLAAGVVPVASAVGMNAEIIEDRVNGRLVHRDQWHSVLGELLATSDGELAALAAPGPELVRESYSHESSADRLVEYFRGIVGGGR